MSLAQSHNHNNSCPSTGELSPQQTAQFLSTTSTSLTSIQSTGRSIKAQLRGLNDVEGSTAWYRKQMAIRNYDARTETIVMSIWQIEPVAPGYLDYYTVQHVTDLIRKWSNDCQVLAAVAAEREIDARALRLQAQRMEADVCSLAGA